MISKITVPTMPNDCESLDTLRRRLRFRAWHRGTLELDLLMGTFADRCLAEFAAEELRQFERLLEEDDPVIDDWITGRQPVSKEQDNKVVSLLRQFSLANAAGTRRAISNGFVNGEDSSVLSHS